MVSSKVTQIKKSKSSSDNAPKFTSKIKNSDGSSTQTTTQGGFTKTSTTPDKQHRYGTPINEINMGGGKTKTIFSDVTHSANSSEEANRMAEQEANNFYGRTPTMKNNTAQTQTTQMQKEIQQNNDLTIIEKIAKMGLKPAELGANLIGRIFGGKGYKYQNTAEQLAQTTSGKILGLGTVGAGLTLGVQSILAKFAPNMAAAMGVGESGGQAVITQTAYKGSWQLTTQRAFGVTAKQSEVLAGKLAQMDSFSLKKMVSSAYGFLRAHKTATALTVGGVVTASSMMNWLASDNIITSSQMMATQTASAVKWDGMPIEQAVINLDIAQGNLNTATRFIEINSKLNPLLIPFRKILITNANAAQQSIDLQKKILGLI